MTSSPRILVIDDDPALLRAMRLSLIVEGFSVEMARDGLEGLERMAQASFDLVLLDLQMPRMDGRAFYRAMRSRGYSTPVLILSAYGADSARAELQAEGAIGKPFDPDFLIDKIKSMLLIQSSRDGHSGV